MGTIGHGALRRFPDGLGMYERGAETGILTDSGLLTSHDMYIPLKTQRKQAKFSV